MDTSFFYKRWQPVVATKPVTSKTPTLVDISGGEDDFMVVAAGMIDIFLNAPQGYQSILVNLLQRHAVYFPSRHDALPPERFSQRLLSPQQLKQFIAEFAYTLRQMAVDEIVSDPVYYQKAFFRDNKAVSPELMRESTTTLDPWVALAAVANATGVAVNIHLVLQGKELPAHLVYLPDTEHASHRAINLQLQDGHRVLASLINPARFEEAKAVKTPRLMPRCTERQPDPALSTCLKRIQEANQGYLQHYRTHSERLQIALVSGEINFEQLLAIYIHAIDQPCPVNTNRSPVGTEFGSQQFFHQLAQHTLPGSRPIRLESMPHQEQVTQELVQALSRGMSLGQLNEDLIYNPIENSKAYPGHRQSV